MESEHRARLRKKMRTWTHVSHLLYHPETQKSALTNGDPLLALAGVSDPSGSVPILLFAPKNC